MKAPCVYVLASKPYGTLYVGVTSDLHKRMAEHTQGIFDGFSKRHEVTHLVYYEMHESMDAAIRREKRLKRWNRPWKYRLIQQMNPDWRDLFDPTNGAIAFGVEGDGSKEPERGNSIEPRTDPRPRRG